MFESIKVTMRNKIGLGDVRVVDFAVCNFLKNEI
jgi:hypothetical protein